MNHYRAMEMADQRQAELQREANLHRQMRAAKTEAREWTTRLPWLLGFGRAAGAGTRTPGTGRAWRLSRS
jgi:hypothetical protein